MSTTKESAVIIEQVAVPAKDSLQPKILLNSLKNVFASDNQVMI